MNKRYLFLGLLAVPFLGTKKSLAATNNKNTVTWEVPPGITKVRVRSWNPDGSKDIDRVLSVEPNQVFRIDVVS